MHSVMGGVLLARASWGGPQEQLPGPVAAAAIMAPRDACAAE
jgi:hypothetical protein